MTVNTPLASLLQQITQAETEFGRPAGSVQLLAVSKTRSVEHLRPLAEQGQQRFGENYVQEGSDKIAALADLALEWHFIGPIQSNKTSTIAREYAWVQSLDRWKIATRLNEQRDPHLPPLQVCIQVNSSGETTKSGVAPAALSELAERVTTLPRLRLRGLMALPAPSAEFSEQRAAFRAVYQMYQDLRQAGFALDTLSMGTSSDMRAAIAEGATLVRIGTALFGPRKK